MGKIVVSENVTLDGVFQDPRGEEGIGRGDWFTRIGEVDRAEWGAAMLAEAQGAEALLLGRRSYEYFAARFPSRSGAWADRLNSMPKYVVSATLATTDSWQNATLLTGDVVGAVAALRRSVPGEIVVYASGRLVRTLTEHDLVDELRLVVHPFVAGAGERLFGTTGAVWPLRLAGAHVLGEGLALLTYTRPLDPGS